MDLYLTDEDVALFWSLVDVKGDNECWPWLGRKTGGGYGYFSARQLCTKERFSMGAHRIANFLLNGNPLSPGLFTCHSCDNPPCCNSLRHLFYGTDAINMQDAASKGRCGMQRVEVAARISGLKNYQSRLSADDVRAIRRSNLSHREIGLEFGLSTGPVSQIRRGLSYRDVI